MTSPSAEHPTVDERRHRTAVRAAAFAVGVGVVLGTVLLGTRVEDLDLTVVLLVVLVEVLGIAVFTGPLLGAAAALVAVVLVNWYLVPPYHTFEIASVDNLVALVVFTLVAVAAALLVELSGRARARAARSAEQAELLGDVVALEADMDADDALERIREALALDRVVLSQGTGRQERVLAAAGVTGSAEEMTLAVPMPEGYRLSGYGPARIGADPAFLSSLAAGAVRAYEGQQLGEQRRRVAELAAIDQARAALLASVGHDLRTPLAGLRVAVDALRQPGVEFPAEDRAALLATIADSTDRLDELITNLLDMSRLEAGAVIARLEPTSLDGVVARAVLGVHGSDVIVDVDEALPAVSTDPALLERIVGNLVSNALRHGGSGGSVAVRAEPRDDAVVLDVVDHGAGIPAPERQRVLEPFHTGDGHPTGDGGTGLGLAIVRGFADATGIGLDLLDTPGGGLTARLTLPRADRTAAA